MDQGSNVTRRSFLKVSSAAALASALPDQQPYAPIANAEARDRKLVIIHLDGGNDGINTVVPHGDPAYREVRKALRLPTKSLHPIADGLGLHESLRDFKGLWDQGQLAVVQGVGYPRPSRSHFESTSVWETGIRDRNKRAGVGWIGAAFDRKKRDAGGTAAPSIDSIYIGSKEPPIALAGRLTQATNLTSLRDFTLPPSSRELRRIAQQAARESNEVGDPRAFLSRVTLGAYEAADRLSKIQSTRNRVRYPVSRLATQLELAATLIGNEHPAQVYYLSQNGYDTHSQQWYRHAGLLEVLSTAVRAFLADIKSLGRADSCSVMIFSEFGRTVKENGSRGTDHGTAGPVFLAGAPIRNGLVGKTPSLRDLVAGEPRWSIDFRQIYATIETEWFGCPKSRFAEAGSTPLPLFT